MFYPQYKKNESLFGAFYFSFTVLPSALFVFDIWICGNICSSVVPLTSHFARRPCLSFFIQQYPRTSCFVHDLFVSLFVHNNTYLLTMLPRVDEVPNLLLFLFVFFSDVFLFIYPTFWFALCYFHDFASSWIFERAPLRTQAILS